MADNNHDINSLILEELRHAKQEMAELKRAIVGDRPMGHKGLVERVETLEASDADQNKKLLILSSTTAALSSAATLIFTYFKDKLFG